MLVEFIVAAGKKEQARSHATLDGDVFVGVATGAAPTEAELVFTCTPSDAQALHDGSLDLSVGFMRGQIKMAGDFGALMRFLPLTAGPNPVVSIRALVPG